MLSRRPWLRRTVLILSASSIVGCSSLDEIEGVKAWIGSSEHQGAVRMQTNEVIKCNDTRFDYLVCFLESDLKKLEDRCGDP